VGKNTPSTKEENMKAIVCNKYGPPGVLHPEELEKPAPKDGEVLLKIQATSLNSYDLHFLRADPFFIRLMAGGFFKPIHPILGADVAGRVETVGGNVRQFKPGDEVFGEIHSGGLAEYACAEENLLVLKPIRMTFAQAAALPMAGLTALQGLRDYGGIRAGQKVLVHGAGGGVGTFAVQIAKSFGTEVAAVCGAKNIDLVRSLGADRVVDYAKEDVTRGDRRFDLIFAANGNHSIFDYRRILNPAGTCIVAGGTMHQIFQGLLLGPMFSRDGGRKLGGFTAHANQKDLELLKQLFAEGKVKPVIDKQYPLLQAPDAFRYLEQGHAKGKVVITVG
jgi:NADPH:quinone reductase-like Zn-dependent oxidoreductase